MALIKLYEATNPSVLYGTENWTGTYAIGFYTRRHDCVVFDNNSTVYKIYRDGTTIRLCQGRYYSYAGYDADLDLLFQHWPGGTNLYNDPIGMLGDPSHPCRFTYNGYSLIGGFVWRGSHYWGYNVSITKSSMTGTLESTLSVTGSITPFFADTVAITDDGIAALIDYDNGTYGVVRFYNVFTNTVLHTSVFDRSWKAWVDTVNKNIWSINRTTNNLQVWSFDVAPQNFTAITMGSNRCRYRQDDVSATLRGSLNEPVPNWPVKWSLSTSEGHLRDEVVLTDANGLTTNLYCGPGVTDYVGGSQTITVETGY